MNKVTYVDYYSRRNFKDAKRLCFAIRNDPDSDELLVYGDIQNGLITVLPTCSIDKMAEILIGCFEKDSNFWSEYKKYCGYNKAASFRGFLLVYRYIEITVLKETASEEKIIDEWSAAYHLNYKGNG